MGTSEADQAGKGDILVMYGYDQIIKTADETKVDRSYALQCRVRYLRDKGIHAANILADTVIEFLDCPPEDVPAYDANLSGLKRELESWQRELQVLRRRMSGKVKGDEITDDMIERARRYPVEMLVEFKRGKTRAWCHDDRNPSAFHGTRTNTVQCPVCGQSFDSIAVLMQRDGLPFADAVRQLQ